LFDICRSLSRVICRSRTRILGSIARWINFRGRIKKANGVSAPFAFFLSIHTLFTQRLLFLTLNLSVAAYIRRGSTLRFPRARDEPPHSQRTFAVGSHRLRFPAGVFMYFLR